jgi:ABC-type bacteriocin/lantibiotic exporter with double-glycine peptidase domain
MDTERQVMEEIYKLNSNVTIIIIAHRLESLGGCNKIYEISDGAVRLVSDVLGVKE